MANRANTVYDGNVAGAGQATVAVSVAGIDSLLVVWQVPDSTVVGDLSTPQCRTYTPTDDDGPGALIASPLPATSVVAAVRSASVTTQMDRYDVRGLEKVQLNLLNGAIGPKNLVIHVYSDN